MNAEIITEFIPESAGWSTAVAEVNEWRGACTQCFAQTELAVTETLLLLRGVEVRGAEVSLRHLVGQRLTDLASAIGPGGAFEAEGKIASAALEQFREHEGLRTLLGHGSWKVTMARNGKWVLIIRNLSITKQTEVRFLQVFEQLEASDILSQLRKKSQKVCASLDNLQRRLATSAGERATK